jgi:hypothetical protein
MIYRTGKVNAKSIEFVSGLLENVSDLGEKYDANLALISELVLMYCEKGYYQKSGRREQLGKVIQLLVEKGTESLIKNVDLLKRHL